MNVPYESQFHPQDSGALARTTLGSVDTRVRASVVNRTHRVVRQRAKVLQERRSHVRGLMVPLGICSILLILTAVAVWSGLYQGVEAVEADVAERATAEGNHFLVVMMWFVPVSIALLAMLWVRHSRSGVDDEAR
jgi:hypothetical protein